MNILFTICGRAGSKGFKSKNLKKLLGYPLSWYPLAAVNLLESLSEGKDLYHVCASSDSEDLLSCICGQKNIPVFPIRRVPALCNDTVAKVLVTVDCLKQADEYFQTKHDLVVDLDITSPLRTAEDVYNAIEKKKQLRDIDVIFSVVRARRSPFFNMVMRQEGSHENYQVVIPSAYTARQQAPDVYDMNASIYVYERKYLLSPELSHRTNSIVVMKDTGVLDIDSEEDFNMMELVAENMAKSDKQFQKIIQSLKELSDS